MFASERSLSLNGQSINLKHYSPAHTDSDISVTFAEADVVHVADTFWNGVYPFIDYSTGGSIDGMIAASDVNLAATTDKTIIIPEHGQPVSNKAELKEFRDMLVGVRENVAALKRQGRSRDEAVAAKPTAAFDGKFGNWVIDPAFFNQAGLRRRVAATVDGVRQRGQSAVGRLEGKVAVITGANSGIGLATAKRFAAEGARVFMTGRRKKELEAAVAEVGHNSRGVEGDVANLADLNRLFAVVKDEAGAIDILFANAGGGEFSALGEITEEHFDRTFGVNVKGTLLHGPNGAAASQRWGLDHPGRLDCRVDRHSGLQRLQRQQGGDPQLRP